MSKFEKAIRIIAILGIILGSWAFAINQVANMLENGHEVLERDALARCASYQVPHVLVADGVAYCYMIYRGEEKMIPLETLEKLYNTTGS